MYLLYSKRSTNVYSLTFAYLSITSSILWIPYGVLQHDTPIVVRSSVEITLLSLCAMYIHYNRCHPVPEQLILTTREPEHSSLNQ